MKNNRNFFAFLWHAFLLAITVTFTDINTVLPALILDVGGTELHVGILTGIMVGIPLLGQLLFAGFLHNQSRKKPHLLTGIYIRILALTGLTLIILYGQSLSLVLLLMIVYSVLMIFTLSGAYAGIAYVDLIGKAFEKESRKKFILTKQTISSIGILISALLTRFILKKSGDESSYVLLFALSAIALALASLGFWLVKEFYRDTKPAEKRKAGSILSTLKVIPHYLKTDFNLRHYIIAANLLGFGTVLVPFYIAMAKNSYNLTGAMVGNLLLIQIVGMVLSNFLWHKIVKHFGFKGMLRVWSWIGFILPLIAITAITFLPLAWFMPIFLFTGMYLGARKMTSEAVMLEITNTENRALYSGIFGTFNLSLAVFPIIIGGVIAYIGYLPVFIFVAVMALLAKPIIQKMNCPVDNEHPSPLENIL